MRVESGSQVKSGFGILQAEYEIRAWNSKFDIKMGIKSLEYICY